MQGDEHEDDEKTSPWPFSNLAREKQRNLLKCSLPCAGIGIADRSYWYNKNKALRTGRLLRLEIKSVRASHTGKLAR